MSDTTAMDNSTRERVIEAALRCLESNDFQRVSMGSIATAANVGRATLYRHFADRDDVLAAVVISETRRVTATLLPIARREADLGTSIVRLVSLLVEVGPKEPTIAALVSRGTYLFTRNLLVDSADDLFEIAAESVDALLDGREHELRSDVTRDDIAEWVLRVTISLLTVRGPRRRSGDELERFVARLLVPLVT